MRAACSRPFLLPFPAMGGVGLAVLLGTVPAQAARCVRLTELTLPNMAVVAATDVPAGPFTPADGVKAMIAPAFCRVQAVATPAPDSRIGFEVWLPVPGAWNGKLLGRGNGG